MAAPIPAWARHPEPLRRGPVVGEAVRLAVAGWRVLLVGENKRALFIPGHQEHGHQNATDDLDELEARVLAAGDRIATAGVAVVLGGAGHPFAVDLDGPCAMAWAEATLGERLAEVPRERTAHGVHLFFAPAPTLRREVRFQPEGWSCTCGSGCGIDLLGHLAEDESRPPSERRTAQALVVAPSPGRTWIGPGPGLPRPEALPPLPEGWLVQRPRPRREAAPVQIVSLPEGVVGSEAGLQALERVCRRMAATPAGGRHDALLRLGRLVGGWVGSGHLEATYAAARLAAAVPGPNNDPAADLATAVWAIQSGAAAPLDPDDPGPGGGKVRRLPRETVVLPSASAPTTTIDEARAVLAERTAPPVGAARLVIAPPGTGKTTRLAGAMVRTELGRGGAALVITPTKDLVDQAANALVEAGVSDATPHYGRHVGFLGSDQGACAAMTLVSLSRPADYDDGEVKDEDELETPSQRALREYAARRVGDIGSLASQRHPVMPTCTRCVIGRATMLRHSARLHRDPAAWGDADTDLRRSLDALGIVETDVPDCGYILQALQEAGNLDEPGGDRSPTCLVAAHEALSAELMRAPVQFRGRRRPGDDQATDTPEPRLLVMDESPPLVETVAVDADQVAIWVARVSALLTEWRAEEVLAVGRRQKNLRRRLARLERVGDALRALAATLVLDPEAFDEAAVLEAWSALGEAAAEMLRVNTPAAVTAPWEEVAVVRQEGEAEKVIPLRAIADSVNFALPRREAGGFEVTPPGEGGAPVIRFRAATPALHVLLGDWEGYRSVLLDATPPWGLRALFEARATASADVEVVDVPARMGRVICHLSGHTFARGRYRALRRGGGGRDEEKAAAALRRDVAKVERETRAYLAHNPGREIAILTHKPVVEKLEEQWKDDPYFGPLLARGVLKAGWYGRHDRGTNEFEGRSVLVFGVPSTSPDAQRAAANNDRAVLAGLREVPEWSDERVRVVRRLPDGREVALRMLAPADPVLRARWDYELSAAIAQAVGRARMADHPDVEVHLFGGYVPDLGRFGFDVEVVEDDEPGAAEDRNRLTHLESLRRAVVAAADLEAHGRRATVRAVQGWCHEQGWEAPRGENVLEMRAWLQAEGLEPTDPAAVARLDREMAVIAARLGVDPEPAEAEAALWEAVERAASDGAHPSVLRALGALAGHAHAVGLGLAEWETEPVARAGP
jgi:hypothetical protein